MVLVTEKKKHPSAGERRRHGHHHKHTKKYHHTYWPYLPLALIIAFGVAFNSLWPTFQSAVLGYATNTSRAGLLLSSNNERVAAGVGKLALNAQLNSAAQAKADDMADRDYWSHNTPEGDAPWVFFEQAGYSYVAAGENLAYGFDSSSGTVAGWMASPPHKQNLLAEVYDDVGFGIADAENYQDSGPQTIVVAMYGARQQVAQQSQPEPPTAPAQQSESSNPPPQQEPEAQSRAEPRQPTEPQTSEESPKPAEKSEPAPTPMTEEMQTSGQQQPEQVARLELLSSQTAGWSMFVVTMIAITAAGVFLFRHSVFWHRVIIKGERFVIKHHFLDIVLVTMAVAAFLITRSSGIIH